MQERRLGEDDERLVTTQAQAGAAVGQHLRQMRIGLEEAGRRVRGVALAWTAATLLQDTTGIRCEGLISLQEDIYGDFDWMAALKRREAEVRRA